MSAIGKFGLAFLVLVLICGSYRLLKKPQSQASEPRSNESVVLAQEKTSSSPQSTVPCDAHQQILVQFKHGVGETEKKRVRSRAGVVLTRKVEVEGLRSSEVGETDLELVRPVSRDADCAQKAVLIIEKSPVVRFAEVDVDWRIGEPSSRAPSTDPHN